MGGRYLNTIRYENVDNIHLDLFSGFNRYQDVKKCWRKVEDNWVLKDVPFIEQWSIDEYKILVSCLQNTISTGGVVIGAYNDDILVGFASVESEFFGSKENYLQLSSIHITYESRNRGIGKELFLLSCEAAKDKGVDKLYISAHSSEETQAFYKSVGCVEAAEYNQRLVDLEPYDCQLEYCL